MTCFLTHDDALRYLRVASSGASPHKEKAAAVAQLFRGHRVDETTAARSAFGDSIALRPLSVAVPSENKRRRNRTLRCKIVGVAALQGMFVTYEPGTGLYVSTPELTFLHLAEILPSQALAAIGCELCGSYSVMSGTDKGFLARSPLTTKAKLSAVLSKAAGLPGVARAKEALSYVVEGSASPMETYLVLRLVLPRRLGGYALPHPLMNHRLSVRGQEGAPRYFVCDLYWPSAKLAVEYDSDAFHTEAENVAYDSRRRVLLSEIGVTVLSATRDQTLDEGKLEEIARNAGKRLGVSMRMRSRSFPRRRLILARTLFRAISYPANMPKGTFEIGVKDAEESNDAASADAD